MITQILEDEEQSLDDLIIKARQDSELKRLIKGNSKRNFWHDFETYRRAEKIVKAVEEGIGFVQHGNRKGIRAAQNSASWGGVAEQSLLAAAYAGLGRLDEAKEILNVVDYEDAEKYALSALSYAYASLCVEGVTDLVEHVETFWTKSVEGFPKDKKLVYSPANSFETYLSALLANVYVQMGKKQDAVKLIDDYKEIIGQCQPKYETVLFHKAIGGPYPDYDLLGNALTAAALFGVGDDADWLMQSIYSNFASRIVDGHQLFVDGNEGVRTISNLALALAHLAEAAYMKRSCEAEIDKLYENEQ
jgi:hypothetical protein